MNILWLIGAIGILALIQVIVFCAFGFKRIQYSRSFDRDRIYAGEAVVMQETISNRKLLPVPWLRVESRMDSSLHFGRMDNLEVTGELHHASLFSLGAFSQIRRSHYVQCLRRGYYPLSTVSISLGDIFGLYTVSRTLPMHSSLLVYPAPLDPGQLEIPSRKWQGDVVIRRWIQPDPYLVNGIREYRRGDSPRDVHWGATARTAQLQVKTHDYSASPRLMFLFNVQREETQWGVLSESQQEILEYGLREVSTLAHFAIRQGLDIGFFANGSCKGWENEEEDLTRSISASGQVNLDRFMEKLARLDVSVSNASFHSYLDEWISSYHPSDMDIIIMSCYDSPRIQERVRALEAMGNSVTLWPMGKEGYHAV